MSLRFEDGLEERILEDVGSEPGNLPLLEFVLEMLWERRRVVRCTTLPMRQIGKVQGR